MTTITEIPPNDVIIGLDLGQAHDYTALNVTEVMSTDPNRYLTRTLDRWLPPRYGQVVERVAAMVPKIREGVHLWMGQRGRYEFVRPRLSLVIDRTGVGRAVGDMFTDAQLDCELVLVTITSGHQVNRDADGGWLVPKKDLMDTALVAMQNDRAKVVEQLEYARTLKAEMQNFRQRYTRTGHETLAAGEDWRREGRHDDLVLAQALALWWGERSSGAGFEPVPLELQDVLAGFGA